MINKIFNYLKKVDTATYKIMKKGLFFCLILSLVSSLVLLIYITLSPNLDIYYIGLSLFKLSCYLGVEFVVCGLVVDTLKKQLT